jgi:hypothetical protein
MKPFTLSLLVVSILIVLDAPTSFASDVLQGSVQKSRKLPFTGQKYQDAQIQTDTFNLGATLGTQSALLPQTPTSDRKRRLPFIGTPGTPSKDERTPEQVGWVLYASPYHRAPYDPFTRAHGDMRYVLTVQNGTLGVETYDQTARQFDLWNRWSERFLHMIYANLAAFGPSRYDEQNPNERSYVFYVYVREDGRIRVEPLPENPYVECITAIAGRPELAFPTKTNSDTVAVKFEINWGSPKRDPLPDMWGRSSRRTFNADPYYYRYSW